MQQNNDNKKLLYKILSCILIVLFVSVLVCKNIFTEEQTYKIENSSYNTATLQSNQVSQNEYFTQLSDDVVSKNIDIVCDFTTNTEGNFENIFQTADGNEGIKLQLNSSNTLSLIVKSKKSTKGDEILIGEVEPNSINKIHIKKRYAKPYEITFNGSKVDTDSHRDKYKVNHILVGKGENSFSGEISNFSLNYSIRTTKFEALKYCSFIEIGLFALLIILSTIFLANTPVYWLCFIVSGVGVGISYRYWLEDFQNIDYICFISIFVFVYLLSYSVFKSIKNYCCKNAEKSCDVIFLCLVFLLMIIPLFNISSEINSKTENRMLAQYKPLIENNTINNNFGSDFDAWFSDRFLGRTLYNDIYNTMRYTLDNYVENDTVFYSKKNKEAFLLPVQPENPEYSEVEKAISHLNAYNAFLKKNNIKFYLLLVPNRNYMFYENAYPYNLHTRLWDVDKTLEEIRKNVDFPIVHPYNALKLRQDEKPIYFKTDHHWTDFGAYIGYVELMKAIKKDFPYLTIEPESDFNIFYDKRVRAGGSDFYSGQLIYGLLNINKRYHNSILKTQYPYFEHKNSNNMVIESFDKNKTRKYHYNNANNNLNVYVMGTSMTENLLLMLPYSFRNTKFHRFVWDLNVYQYSKEILKEKPDIVILCLVNDNIPHLWRKIFGEE